MFFIDFLHKIDDFEAKTSKIFAPAAHSQGTLFLRSKVRKIVSNQLKILLIWTSDFGTIEFRVQEVNVVISSRDAPRPSRFWDSKLL